MATHEILDEFLLEAATFRDLVTSRSDHDWDLITPAVPWRIRDQISHLTFVFNLAAAAASDEERFNAMVAPAAEIGFDAAVNKALAMFNDGAPDEVIGHFDRAVAAVGDALRAKSPDETVPWLVNPLPSNVLTAAGLLELFAHRQDVADALGVDVKHTDAVRHLVPFVHRTIPFGYLARDLTPPVGDFYFALELPSGETVTAGPPDAVNIVCGEAVDLVLLASRRRHQDDLLLHPVGPEAWSYLEVAQAYRGSAGPGRQPLTT